MTLLLAAAMSGSTATTTTTTSGATTTTTTSGGTWTLPNATEVAPYTSQQVCSIPTYDGSGATIHPAVLDMGDLWNGYRWWMANTPYAGGDDDLENPCIWGSNDRQNWTVPAGLTNPIYPNPADAEFPDAYYSDTELNWDPDEERMVMYYRYVTGAGATNTEIRAATSPDGVTWTYQGIVLTIPSGTPSASPAVWRTDAGVWHMWTMKGDAATRHWTAPAALGPWTYYGYTVQPSDPNNQFRQYHGDIIFHDGYWWAMQSATSISPSLTAAISVDGYTWYKSGNLMAGGWAKWLYRPTITPSTKAGWMDVWSSATADGVPGGRATGYTRVPFTVWTDLLP